MSEFKAGDRVRYTGARSLREDGRHLSPEAVGKTGVITGNPGRGNGGKWDDGGNWAGYYPENLELIDQWQPDPRTVHACAEHIANLPVCVKFGCTAKAIADELIEALLPTPVDPDLIEAREIAGDIMASVDYYSTGTINCVRTGNKDDSIVVKSVLAGIKSRARK